MKKVREQLTPGSVEPPGARRRFCGAWPLQGLGSLALEAIWSLMTPPVLLAADLAIENNTGRVICELRLSGPDASGWREDLLQGTCLVPGRIWRTPSAGSGGANLLAVFENGDYLVYYGLECGSYRYLKLGAGEAELFEWNPAGEKP